jgi:SAM-dependent methyltransferase
MDTGQTAMRGDNFYDRDGAAERYLQHRHGGTSSPNVVMEEPAFLARLGTVADKRILDLGCGDGSFGARAMKAGAAVYRGVDASAEMTRRATARLDGTGAEVVRQDIADVRAPAGSFDLVVSGMALHYLPEPGPVLARSRTWLSPGGRLIFSVVHPVITAPAAPPVGRGPRTDWTVDNYFEPGERRRDWFGHQVVWHHRSVEQYVTAVLNAGFTLTALQECPPSGELLADRPEELYRRRRVPLFLLFDATRDDRPA